MEETVQEISTNVNQFQQFFSGHLPDVLAFGVKVVLAVLAFFVGGKLIAWLIRVGHRSMEKAGVDKGVIQFSGSLCKFVLYALLVFNIAIQFGVKESSVAALLGTAGVTVGLGLQGGLENLAGGVMLLLFKPFQVGDYVVEDSTKGIEGTVYKIEICYTTLLTVDNKKIVIPNGTLSNSTITNVTAREHRNLEFKLRISYRSDFKKAKEIVVRLLAEDPDARDDKGMLVYIDELGESAIILVARVWILTDRYWEAKWRLNERIKDEFDRAGIELAYPQMEVHIRGAEKSRGTK